MLRENIVERCNSYGTTDSFARISQGMATFLTFLLFPLLLVAPLFQLPLTLLSLASLPTAQAIGDVIHAAMAWPVIWLGQVHNNVPILRPLLILPATLLAVLAQVLTGWLPNYGIWSDRALKLAVIEAWPNSQYALRSFNDIALAVRNYEGDDVDIEKELAGC